MGAAGERSRASAAMGRRLIVARVVILCDDRAVDSSTFRQAAAGLARARTMVDLKRADGNRWERGLRRARNIADVRELARRRLPPMIFDFTDGGAEDEATLGRNSSGFGRWRFQPRSLVDVRTVDISTTVMSQPISLPVVLSPCGLARLNHPDGERAAARAAAKAGTVFALSTGASCSIEDVAEASAGGPLWMQLYVWRDRDVVKELIARARDAGYVGCVLTVDVPTVGNRERDAAHGMALPPRITPRNVVSSATRPGWWWPFITSPEVTFEIVRDKAAGSRDAGTLGAYASSQIDPGVTWDDLAWMVDAWDGNFAIKGVMRPDDAVRAVEAGVQAVIVSNHGGRQLDHAVSPIDVLADVVAAVDGRAEVILDGGVRRGTDVCKALALGAQAVTVGRPYMWGLGAGGEAGVERVLEIFRAEITRTLTLLGCPTIADLDRSFVSSLP